MRVIHLSLLVALCSPSSDSLKPVGLSSSEIVNDHVLELLQDAAIFKKSRPALVPRQMPQDGETRSLPKADKGGTGRARSQAASSDALEEGGHLHTSLLSVGHAGRPPDDSPQARAGDAYESLVGLLTQIQTGVRQLGKQALGAMTQSSGGSSNIGMIIGISVAGVFLCLCMGCVVARWWLRTPNIKHGWRRAGQQRVQNRKYPGSTDAALQGGGGRPPITRPSLAESPRASTHWPPIGTATNANAIGSNSGPTDTPILH